MKLIVAEFKYRNNQYRELGNTEVADTKEYKYLTEVAYPSGMALYLSKKPFNQTPEDETFRLSNVMGESSETCKKLWKKLNDTRDEYMKSKKGNGVVVI